MSADLTAAWLSDPAFHARFWARVDKRGPRECWEWTGSRKPPFGYGHCYLGNRKHTTASRVSLAMALGRVLQPGEVAGHRCDNPPCVNPAHLFLGSQSDNIRDCVSKGRANRAQGSATAAAKLTEEQVREIRAWPYYVGHQNDIADAYGISRPTASAIRTRRTWRHVV